VIDLYNEVNKEVTNIWKRDMRDDAQLIARRNKEKQILKDCALLTKEKLGIDQPIEGIDPLAKIKRLVKEVIDTSENNQLEIQH
jgi:hypothetical protein